MVQTSCHSTYLELQHCNYYQGRLHFNNSCLLFERPSIPVDRAFPSSDSGNSGLLESYALVKEIFRGLRDMLLEYVDTNRFK